MQSIQHAFNALLRQLKAKVSTDQIRGTDSEEIDRAGKKLFKHHWGGAISANDFNENKHNHGKFYIMNILDRDTEEKMGHWMAMTDGKVWDSFHRPLHTISRGAQWKPFVELNCLSLPMQPDANDDCGERSLCALILYRDLYLQ